jgi:hypothetical protein
MGAWFKALTTAAVLGALLVAAFILVRVTGWFDRYVESEQVATLAGYPAGVFYRVNRAVFELKATVEIAACRSVNIAPILKDDPTTTADSKRTYRLVEVTVTEPSVTVRTEIDPAELWRILPDTIEGAWWATTFSATLDAQGRLQVVDATSTAVKAEEIAAPLAKALAAVAPASAEPIAVGPTSVEIADDAVFCGGVIHDALARRKAVEDRLAGKPPPDETAVLQSELARSRGVLKKQLAVALVPQRPPAAIDFRKATAEELKPHGLAYRVAPETMFDGLGAGLRRELAGRAFEFRILAEPGPSRPRASKVKGIVHRIPAQARWVVCRMRCQLEDGEPPAAQRLTGPEPVAIPQLGIEAVVPIRRAPFSDRKTKLTFDAGGVLTAVETGDTPQVPKAPQ